MVEVRGAAFGYAGRPVVRADGLRLRRGRCLGIFGPNGAGKTTVVRGITGLLTPVAGEVVRRVGGVRFGYLPQHRAMELTWPMSALDAAALATSARRRFGWLRHTRPIMRTMETLGVSDLARRPFPRLSGGQQQRVLLAGALAAAPDVLVLDEPTDGLDARSRLALLDLLKGLTSDGLCAVVISHEVEDLCFLSHEVAWLHVAGEADGPSDVELLSPDAFAVRMDTQRWAV
jgi:ABC-type Mn2+/Zn2+ transport system ATPase subunit